MEFGAGFRFAGMRGSEANDPFVLRGGRIETATNRNGGVNGGITNGMPLVLRTVLKPTPSIYKEQRTVDYAARRRPLCRSRAGMTPASVPRAAVVQNTLTAFGLLDLLTVRYGTLAQKDGLPTHKHATERMWTRHMEQTLYGLIGAKLGHSYSKLLHEQLGGYRYELIPLPTEAEARAFMEKRAFTAINVTIPYKQLVIPYCDEIEPKPGPSAR